MANIGKQYFEPGIRPMDGVDVRQDYKWLSGHVLTIAPNTPPLTKFALISGAVGDWVNGTLIRIDTMHDDPERSVQETRIRKIHKRAGDVYLVEFGNITLTAPPMPGGEIRKIVGFCAHHIDRRIQETQDYIARMTRKLGRPPKINELKVFMGK